jgi:hypothetical protein
MEDINGLLPFLTIAMGVVLFLLWWFWELFSKKPCTGFKEQNQNPELVRTSDEARALALHNRTCMACNMDLQVAIDKPLHLPNGTYWVWQHLEDYLIKRLKDAGFNPRKDYPITDAEIHAVLCQNCAGRVEAKT